MKAVLNGQYPAAVTGFHTNEPQRLNEMYGFLGSCQPRKLDVSLCGLRVYFKLADANKAFYTNAGDPTTAVVSLKKIHLYVDAIELQDGGVYNAAIHRRLDSGPLEIPYKQYYLNQAGPITTGYHSLLINLSTGSLDTLIGGFINNDNASYTAVAYPSPLTAVSAFGGSNVSTSIVGLTDVKSGYFVHGVGASNTWLDSQFSVNSVVYPSWAAEPAEAFDQTVQSLGKLKAHSFAGGKPWLNSLDAYKTLAANHVVSFEYPNGDEGSRLRSGLNTLGNLSSIEWRTNLTVGSNAPTKFLFAGTTAVVRIGKMKQVEKIS